MTPRRGPAVAPLLRGGPRPAHTPSPAGSRRRLTTLLTRLTERDVWLLDMLAEHTVLTSAHVNALWNNSQRNTNRRLLTLYRLDLLDSFRPRTSRGTAREHYLLDRTGADVVAARHATTPPPWAGAPTCSPARPTHPPSPTTSAPPASSPPWSPLHASARTWAAWTRGGPRPAAPALGVT
nr:replication-relaxation family protein [Streptacidiphilus rugosus]